MGRPRAPPLGGVLQRSPDGFSLLRASDSGVALCGSGLVKHDKTPSMRFSRRERTPAMYSGDLGSRPGRIPLHEVVDGGDRVRMVRVSGDVARAIAA